jgi:D-alanyl-D-alanine carboxypeptidase
LKNSELPKKPYNSSSSDMNDDIPIALRVSSDVNNKVNISPLMLIIGGIIGFVFLSVGSGFFFFLTAPKQTVNSPINSPTLPNTTTTNIATEIPTATSTNNPINNNNSNNNETILGHLPYQEAPESELIPITADGKIKMRKSAAIKFQAMSQAARNAGIILSPISAFRSVKDQNQLFFGVGAQRNQTPAERAALSAPPGHSEHHTGYAIDIGDGKVPATNLQATFENTQAYLWLQANAAKFSFEISFPKDNIQGVSYEPWHWRFVGNSDSLETFYKARNMKPVKTP